LYHLATKLKPQISHHIPLIVKHIVTRKLDTPVRVEKAIEYTLAHINNVDLSELDRFCGVGVVVTPEEIEAVVEDLIKEYEKELLEKRYRFNAGPLMQKVRGKLPWADGKAIKSEIDVQIFDLLGPKTEEDLAPVQKSDKKSKSAAPAKPKQEEKVKNGIGTEPVNTSLTIVDVMKKINFHAPGENYKTDGYVITKNTEQLLKEHLKVTGGKVQTRFPPEPNGILHIGHAKAININFGYAAANSGVCYLRYDDTNPEKEEEKFFTGIKDMVCWLGK
jgi:glutaminyl-tRNA synthetase